MSGSGQAAEWSSGQVRATRHDDAEGFSPGFRVSLPSTSSGPEGHGVKCFPMTLDLGLVIHGLFESHPSAHGLRGR